METHADRKAPRERELLKAELLASVSHELRSPLTSIKGYVATLLRHEQRISREERHEFLLAINDASDRLAGIIDSFLEMSELETGRSEIKRAPSRSYLGNPGGSRRSGKNRKKDLRRSSIVRCIIISPEAVHLRDAH